MSAFGSWFLPLKMDVPGLPWKAKMFPEKNLQSGELKEVTAIPAWEFCSQVQGSCCDWGWTLGNSEGTSILVADLGAEGVIKPHRDQECITSDGCDVLTLSGCPFNPHVVFFSNTEQALMQTHIIPWLSWCSNLEIKPTAISATEKQWWWIRYTCKYILCDAWDV